MSDKETPKKKRGYRLDDGKALAYDLRVRMDAGTMQRLAKYAAKHKTSKAAAARSLLQSALSSET